MTWDLQWGSAIRAIEAAADAGSAVAQSRLDSRPEVPAWAQRYWQCFTDLASDRPSGMGAAPLPWRAIDQWAARHGIDDLDEFAELVRVVRHLDSVWMDWIGKHPPKPPPKPPKGGK